MSTEAEMLANLAAGAYAVGTGRFTDTSPAVLDDEMLGKIANNIAKHKGWDGKSAHDPLFMALVRETVLMTVRGMEMAGLRVIKGPACDGQAEGK